MSDAAKLSEATSAAVIVENSTGVPAAVLLAQWALESGWGDSCPERNCFGIKVYPNCYGRQLLRTSEWFTGPELAHFLSGEPGRTATLDPHSTVTTTEGRQKYIVEDWFATFPTLAACFERRAQMFDLGRYKPITDKYRQDRDLKSFVDAFGPIYATSPTYSDTVLKIANQANVTLALNQARTGDIVA